jgi:hypothetical protein
MCSSAPVRVTRPLPWKNALRVVAVANLSRAMNTLYRERKRGVVIFFCGGQQAGLRISLGSYRVDDYEQ